MKVYVIPAWYPQDENDTTAIFFRQQAHALADRGHRVTVIHIEPVSFTRLFRQPRHDVRVWQDGNVRTVFHKAIVPIPGKFGAAQERYISRLFYRIIKKQIAEDEKAGLGRPDLLHAHVSHSCAYYCLYAKDKLGIPLAVTEHYSGLLLGEATEREYERVRDTINGSDAFIFVGSNFQKVLCGKLDIVKQTYFIPNLVEVDRFEVKSDGGNDGRFTFLSACNLKKNKSVDLVVRAFHKAFDRDLPVRLVIAGDGDERSAIEQLISELGEEDRVEMIGRYSREQSKAIFSGADAFVLTSKVETFGIVYIEALASGLPCIGTAGQGADDIINDSNGFLVEYGDVDALAARMAELYIGRGRYDPERIRHDCVERFSADAVCGRIEEVYSLIIGDRKQVK